MPRDLTDNGRVELRLPPKRWRTRAASFKYTDCVGYIFSAARWKLEGEISAAEWRIGARIFQRSCVAGNPFATADRLVLAASAGFGPP
jgi:hypothetical protein